MKITQTLITLLSFWTLALNAYSFDLIDYRNEVDELQEKVAKRWSDLEQKQQDPRWVDSFTKAALPGTVFQAGWVNPKVQRDLLNGAQISPHLINETNAALRSEWWTLDEVTMAPSLLENLAVLTSNILFHQHVLPIVQAGPQHEKKFIHGRRAKTYQEALLKSPSDLSSIPLEKEDLLAMSDGEFFSTQTSKGIFVRAGGGILPLLGVEIPLYLNIGPRARLQTRTSLQVTVAKESDQHLVIGIEQAKIQSFGQSLGFGVFFEDVLNAPITIGIDSSEGFMPLQYVRKNESRKLSGLAYRINMDSARAREAYHAFLGGDLTLLDDLIEEGDHQSVEMLYVKQGEEQLSSESFGINLLFWRSSWHQATRQGSYQTIFHDGEVYEYHEYEKSREQNNRFFSTHRSQKRFFLAQIPDHSLEKQRFMLDSKLEFTVTEADGQRVEELTEMVKDWGHLYKIPIIADAQALYGDVTLTIHTHFSHAAIFDFSQSLDFDVYISVATAYRYNDPMLLVNSSLRNKYIYAGIDDEEKDKRRREINTALSLAKKLIEIRDLSQAKDQAQKLVELLSHKSRGPYAHKALLYLIDTQKIVIQGNLKGKDLL